VKGSTCRNSLSTSRKGVDPSSKSNSCAQLQLEVPLAAQLGARELGPPVSELCRSSSPPSLPNIHNGWRSSSRRLPQGWNIRNWKGNNQNVRSKSNDRDTHCSSTPISSLPKKGTKLSSRGPCPLLNIEKLGDRTYENRDELKL
jgi:hypothetical protein